MARPALLACLVVLGCRSDDPGSGRPPAKRNPPSGPDCAKAKPHGALAWIEEDYAAALRCARVMNVPIVLDLWAPWCHRCITMQTEVFADPSLAALQDQFVFASLDTDREENAAAVGKFALTLWPTFYVIDTNEKVLARFIGGATLEQFKELVAAGGRAANGGLAAADARLLGAERALAARDLDTADAELTAALAAAPAVWPRRAEAIRTLLVTKFQRDRAQDCLALADVHMDDVGRSAIATNFWWTAIECATKRAGDEPDRASSVRGRAIAKLHEAIADPNAPLSAGDRVEAHAYLRDALKASGKHAEARAVCEKSRALVDDAYAKATTPFARMRFAWHRADAYAYLGRGLELVDDLVKLATELPSEYHPPAVLGLLFLRSGKLDEAAKWTDKAIDLAYGPPKAWLLTQRADIALATGDRVLERRYRGEAVMLWESMPAGQQVADEFAKAKLAFANADAAVHASHPIKPVPPPAPDPDPGEPDATRPDAGTGSGSTHPGRTPIRTGGGKHKRPAK